MKNIVSILFAACVCTLFSACTSGDYNASPDSSGSTITKGTLGTGTGTGTGTSTGTGTGTGTGSGTMADKSYTATATMTATVNGAAWTASSITVTYQSATKILLILGSSGSGLSATSVQISFNPYATTGAYPVGSSGGVTVTKISTTVGTSGTVNMTADDKAYHFVGTFNADAGTNHIVTNGVFDVKP